MNRRAKCLALDKRVCAMPCEICWTVLVKIRESAKVALDHSGLMNGVATAG